MLSPVSTKAADGWNLWPEEGKKSHLPPVALGEAWAAAGASPCPPTCPRAPARPAAPRCRPAGAAAAHPSPCRPRPLVKTAYFSILRLTMKKFSPGLFLVLLEPHAASSGLKAHCFYSLRWNNRGLHRTYLFSSSSNHYYLFLFPLRKWTFDTLPGCVIEFPARFGVESRQRQAPLLKGEKNHRKNVEENLTRGKKSKLRNSEGMR